MRRRIVLKAVGATTAFFAPGCHLWAKNLSKPFRNGTTDRLGTFFSHGVLSAKMPDGNWSLWVRTVEPNKAPSHNIVLQVATDENFSQIVHQSTHVAYYARSYIVRTIYKSNFVNTTLYFRFVSKKILDTSNMYTLRTATSDIGSKTGKLDPWKIDSWN
jgi:phosphodiesterase/alkaline phosphatase D-like protein